MLARAALVVGLPSPFLLAALLPPAAALSAPEARVQLVPAHRFVLLDGTRRAQVPFAGAIEGRGSAGAQGETFPVVVLPSFTEPFAGATPAPDGSDVFVAPPGPLLHPQPCPGTGASVLDIFWAESAPPWAVATYTLKTFTAGLNGPCAPAPEIVEGHATVTVRYDPSA